MEETKMKNLLATLFLLCIGPVGWIILAFAWLKK
nr:MAG TPA: hypothetical protein [Caudoviricetes sp.]